ncbi:Dihydrofolate synthase/folylpolyglutamate synthase [Halomicronema hongdechloris C2206]|uniref:tetrahydrofolate synthase n=1 Tax=Halomicronema hongdechloris C2206 TaxID=1641165 RepID=A0A1Z3HID4_9CYAN|nr:folylpolyglutamate synthase/dihydrofolate synthase family protein [Halomicronema hongdechloris]ASC70082.1 Dihydrofolate synthase/folylpolyglutamate synthase [Halomicronema hongdechloris C2206]
MVDPGCRASGIPPVEAGEEAEIARRLAQFERFGVNLGLARIEQLLARLGHPEKQVPLVHVAGSNGKGSVCAYLSSVLTQAGYRVGRYTSPHLVSWRERLCINERPIAAADLSAVLAQVEAVIPPSQEMPTQFEVLTAAAWLYFAQQAVDVAVVEVGLGGRLDATNVCEHPLVTVITSLSREHWQRLGPTLADIAREKAGILKPGCPAVIGPLPADAKAVVAARLAELDCPAIWPAPARDLGQGWAAVAGHHDGAVGQGEEEFIPSPWRYRLPFPGPHQLINSALAIATLRCLQAQGWAIAEAAMTTGLAQARWPGRLQWLTWQDDRGQGWPLLVDGAHNPAAAMALRAYVDSLELAPVGWLMGMLVTKDHRDIFQALLRPGDHLHLVPVARPYLRGSGRARCDRTDHLPPARHL